MHSNILWLALSLLVISCIFKKDEFRNEILWDTWGIPHIYGKSEGDLYERMGWAQMRSHGDLLLRLYGEARGKSSAYWGGDFERDSLLHQLDVIAASKRACRSMSATSLEIVDAFATGINAYATENGANLDEKYRVALPITREDIVAHIFRVLYYELLINRNLGPTDDWTPGSNAWAINGAKTAGEHAMLLANPHLPWEDFWMFYEAQLITDANSLYGTTLVGLPVIGIGFNEHLGWTHTVNTLDNVDLYELSVDRDTYQMDGNYRPFEVDTMWLEKRVAGHIREVPLVRKRSAFGMILTEGHGKALAVRWPNMDGSKDVIRQWQLMGKAQSLAEFQDAISLNALPLFNILYADDAKNILYHFGGHVPKKNGDWDKWRKIVPTHSSEDIWTSYYATSTLPGYINPASQWIQNANDPPYTSTFPTALSPADFPSHIAPNHMGFRPQRSAHLMHAATDLTLDEFLALKNDTKSEIWLRLKDDFTALRSETTDSLALAALDFLDDWDGALEVESKEAVFFIHLMETLQMSALFEKDWSYEDPMQTPDGFMDPKKVIDAITQVAQEHQAMYGGLEVAYGDLYRMRVGSHEYPANGGYGNLGLFRTINFAPDADEKFYSIHGDSYVCAIEFGNNVRAKAILAYGNATQKGNPHIGDQLQLFVAKEFRDVWLTREEHLAHLELRE